MSKATQSYRLFQLLKAGDVVSKQSISTELKIDFKSVPVYIHELKKTHKADVLSVRNGRKVTGYKLVDKNLKVPQYRKNSLALPPELRVVKSRAKNNKKNKAVITAPSILAKVDASAAGGHDVPVLDKDAEVTQISEREFADIADSLGVSSSHSID
jgi:biotin operon repressor